jgi:hypothetical protein
MPGHLLSLPLDRSGRLMRLLTHPPSFRLVRQTPARLQRTEAFHLVNLEKIFVSTMSKGIADAYAFATGREQGRMTVIALLPTRNTFRSEP